jgi:hypothetical protein
VRFSEKRLILRFLRFSLPCVRFRFHAFEAKITLFFSSGRSDQKRLSVSIFGLPYACLRKRLSVSTCAYKSLAVTSKKASRQYPLKASRQKGEPSSPTRLLKASRQKGEPFDPCRQKGEPLKRNPSTHR